MTLEAIKYENGALKILDQLLLPSQTKYIHVNSVKDGWEVINKMQVRGAPAIAIVGCLSLAVELQGKQYATKDDMLHDIIDKLRYLTTARPTAINIKTAAEDLCAIANTLKDQSANIEEFSKRFVENVEKMLAKDISDNKAIGDYGAKEILIQYPPKSMVRILTHCNTGSLATAGYGTALGVIRSLHQLKRLEHVYCTETRPYNQGARLTAYELVHDQLPATLICDDMVAALMRSKHIAAVVVGADRVVANGDTANKIGTYQIAVLANYHKVPFYVAAPFTSIDKTIATGEGIVIEERPEKEMACIGGKRIAAEGISCWNPAFDVTPASLITGIITERRVFRPDQLKDALN